MESSHTLVARERGKGRPKESQVNRRREVCEWEGCVCVRKAIGGSYRFMFPGHPTCAA